MLAQYNASKDNQVFAANNAYWTKKKPLPRPTHCQDYLHDPDELRQNARSSWYIPRFERTRVVTITNNEGQLFANCSYHFLAQNAVCCRHIHALLNGKSVKTDESLRWWLIYVHYYLVNPEMTSAFDSVRKASFDQIPVAAPDLKHPEEFGRDNIPVCFFSRSLNQLCLVGPCYWTQDCTKVNTPCDYGFSIVPKRQSQTTLGTTSEFQASEEMQQDLSSQNNLKDDDNMPHSESVPPYTPFHSFNSQITSCVSTKDRTKKVTIVLHTLHAELLRSERVRVERGKGIDQ